MRPRVPGSPGTRGRGCGAAAPARGGTRTVGFLSPYVQAMQELFRANTRSREFPAHGAKVHSVAWSCCGRRLASGSFDKTASVFLLEKDRLVSGAWREGGGRSVPGTAGRLEGGYRGRPRARAGARSVPGTAIPPGPDARPARGVVGTGSGSGASGLYRERSIDKNATRWGAGMEPVSGWGAGEDSPVLAGCGWGE